MSVCLSVFVRCGDVFSRICLSVCVPVCLFILCGNVFSRICPCGCMPVCQSMLCGSIPWREICDVLRISYTVTDWCHVTIVYFHISLSSWNMNKIVLIYWYLFHFYSWHIQYVLPLAFFRVSLLYSRGGVFTRPVRRPVPGRTAASPPHSVRHSA